jgi:hypothetical protein
VRSAATLAALLALACAGASGPAAEVAPASPEERAWLAAAEARGREMYELDRAAWRATDALFAEAADAASQSVVGWIALPQQDGWLVRFLTAQPDGSFASRYDVLVGEDREALGSHTPPEPLPPEEQAMARARELGIASMTRRCSARYNTVVLRDASGEWRVYLLPATPDADEVVLAGFDLARVSADGRELLEFAPLSRSCVAQRADPSAAAYYITHSLHPLPIDTHVFTSLTSGRALFVVTDDSTTWKVEGGRIERMEPDAAPEAP